MNTSIALPEHLYQRIAAHAHTKQLSPEQVVIEVLNTQFEPQHPYVEMLRGAGGTRPVIKGTRTGVDAVVGYSRAGYSPDEIAVELLPHLKLAEVYDALSYYADHKDELDRMVDRNSSEAWRQLLVVEMGEQDAKKLLGEV